MPLFSAPSPAPPSLSAILNLATAQGKFQGLDLNEELYLGGYPDYGAIPKVGLSSGFIGEPLPSLTWLVGKAHGRLWAGPYRMWLGLGGPPSTLLYSSRAHPPGCVRELRIQGEEIVFHDLNLTAHGISHCPTCRDRPCQVTP